MLEVSLFGVGTVLRLTRHALLTLTCPRQATNEYAPPLPLKDLRQRGGGGGGGKGRLIKTE